VVMLVGRALEQAVQVMLTTQVIQIKSQLVALVDCQAIWMILIELTMLVKVVIRVEVSMDFLS